jgi:hypothetical protein
MKKETISETLSVLNLPKMLDNVQPKIYLMNKPLPQNFRGPHSSASEVEKFKFSNE